jgi:hypothetical protein
MRYMLLIPVCLATSGCFPYHYTDRPGINGTVVNAASQQPVVGAGIAFGRTNDIVTQTTADGSFAIPPKKQWGIWIIPQDVFTSRYAVSIRRDGFQDYETEVLSNPADGGKRATKQLGVISITPVSR